MAKSNGRRMFTQKRRIWSYLSGLNSQLFFFVILPISILLIAITFGSLTLHQDAMRDLVAARDQRTVSSSARALGEQLDHRMDVIQSIGIRASADMTQDDFLSSVAFLLNDFDAGLALLSPDGSLIWHTGDSSAWADIETEVLNFLPQASRNYLGAPQIFEPFYLESRDDIYSAIFYQSREDSPIITGVFSVTNLARENLAGILSFDNVGSVFLVGQNGNLLFQTGKIEVSVELIEYPGVTAALKGETGTTFLDAEDGEHVIVFSPVTPTNWALVIDEPWREITNPLLRFSESGSLILIPIVIFALVAIWFATLKIIQPLRSFREQAVLFTKGDFEAFREPVGGIEEIQTLQSTFIGMSEEVEKAQQVLSRYVNILTKGQEDERKRLARELHDDTLQSLIALNHRVMLAKRQADPSELDSSLQEIENMLAKTMQELRRLTRALRPIYLEDLGLVSALESYALEISETAGTPISFQSKGKERRLSDTIEIALYRIAQEAISNINRHSKATKAMLSLTFQDSSLELLIEDNGVGFDPIDPGELSQLGHYGLLGIHERVAIIEADYSIQSEPGNGTQISIRVPY